MKVRARKADSSWWPKMESQFQATREIHIMTWICSKRQPLEWHTLIRWPKESTEKMWGRKEDSGKCLGVGRRAGTAGRASQWSGFLQEQERRPGWALAIVELVVTEPLPNCLCGSFHYWWKEAGDRFVVWGVCVCVCIMYMCGVCV